MTLSLFGRPALLFLPASRPSAIPKAQTSTADLVILDLEDAVKPDDKETARDAAVEALAKDWPMPVGIRINGLGSPWSAEDCTAVCRSRASFVVVPMAADPAAVRSVRENTGKPALVMIETAAGVLAAAAIAREAAGLIAGTNDLAADLRLPAVNRTAMSVALQTILLAARAAGIAAFDGVFNRLDDAHGFGVEVAHSRSLGFDGKSLIHPDQIAPCQAAFRPSDEELARATRLVAAVTGGAERFEGEMVEAMHVAAARRLLERARR